MCVPKYKFGDTLETVFKKGCPLKDHLLTESELMFSLLVRVVVVDFTDKSLHFETIIERDIGKEK